MQAHAVRRPWTGARSLRDAVHQRRFELSAADRRFMQQLQSAAALTRHIAVQEICAKVKRFARRFDGNGAKVEGWEVSRREGARLQSTRR